MALSAFKQAFADARKSGDKTFEFGGKKYTTQLKEEASAPVKAPSSEAGPSATPSAGSQMGPGSSATKSESPRFKSPIVKFFEDVRERGNKDLAERGMKKGGKVKKMASGGSASSRADGIASKGKTRGKMC
jgi:hypothetical protein